MQALLGRVAPGCIVGERLRCRGMAATAGTHPLLGRRVIAAVREQVFEAQVSVQRPAMLADHKIQGKVIMPGAAYLEMALAAGRGPARP